MTDQMDLEFAQGRFTDDDDDRRYREWLDRVQAEDEILREHNLQVQHDIDECF